MIRDTFNLLRGEVSQPACPLDIFYFSTELCEFNKIHMAQDLCWYVKIAGKPNGPLSMRDIDVLLRTNDIETSSLVWKEGFQGWRPLNELQQLRQLALSATQSMRGELQWNKERSQQLKNQVDSEDPGFDEDDRMLELTVESLLKNSFHKGKDGLWNIYDQKSKTWTSQKEEPVAEIAKLKGQLLKKLRRTRERSRGATEQLQKRKRKKSKKALQKKKSTWYQAKKNTFIYASGLPSSISLEQCKLFFQRAGVIRLDRATGLQKIKLYKDQNGRPKGDVAVSYAKQQSVQLAIEMLDGRQISPGNFVKVQRAHFQQKSEIYKPREKSQLDRVQAIRNKYKQNNKLQWAQARGEGLLIVILKNLFSPQQVQSAEARTEIEQDIKSELQKIGPLKRFKLYPYHSEGVIQVKFAKDQDAESCIAIMNGRFFGGRQVQADYWDGKSKFEREQGGVLQMVRILEFGQNLEKE